MRESHLSLSFLLVSRVSKLTSLDAACSFVNRLQRPRWLDASWTARLVDSTGGRVLGWSEEGEGGEFGRSEGCESVGGVSQVCGGVESGRVELREGGDRCFRFFPDSGWRRDKQSRNQAESRSPRREDSGACARMGRKLRKERKGGETKRDARWELETKRKETIYFSSPPTLLLSLRNVEDLNPLLLRVLDSVELRGLSWSDEILNGEVGLRVLEFELLLRCSNERASSSVGLVAFGDLLRDWNLVFDEVEVAVSDGVEVESIEGDGFGDVSFGSKCSTGNQRTGRSKISRDTRTSRFFFMVRRQRELERERRKLTR